MDEPNNHNASSHEAQEKVLNEQEQCHHPSDGTSTSIDTRTTVHADVDADTDANLDVGVVMKHLQKALAKIEHLEVEIHSLKSTRKEKEIDDNGAGREYSYDVRGSRGRDDDARPDLMSKFKFKSKLISTQEVSEDNISGNVSSLRNRPLQIDSIYQGGRNGDEEQNIGESFLSSMYGTNNGNIKRNMNTDMIVSKVAESGAPACTASSEKLHLLEHKYEELVQSISEIRKEQSRTNEELCSLVSNEIEDLNDNEQFQINSIGSTRSRPKTKSSKFGRSVEPEITSRERKMRMTMFGRAPSILMETEMQTSLDEDTFSLMMISPVGSKPWILGGFSFSFQIALGIMIAIDQLASSSDFILVIPFRVNGGSFRVAQFLSIILCLSTQSDILTSIRSFVLLGKGSNWAEIISEGSYVRPSIGQWLIRVGLPNVLKLSQGLVVTFVSFIIIVENKDTIPLLKDFTSLMIISEFDNILFHLAAYGYLGEELFLETERITEIAVTRDMSVIGRNKSRHDIGLVRLAFVSLLMAMFAGWGAIFRLQEIGTMFDRRFPDCGKEHFKLALDEMGDDKCYGGPFNTLECKYEDGDCSNFNTEYPDCNGAGLDHLLNVEDKVGNRHCDTDFNIPQCEYDGGDCCPYEIHLHPSFGDGICNGGEANTSGCKYDNEDCKNFNEMHPKCPLDALSKMESSKDVILGNGICEGGGYNVDICGFEHGDCAEAQIGQDIVLTGVLSPYSDKIDFDMQMSSDGSKILIGMPHTNFRGQYDLQNNGTVVVYYYNSSNSTWINADLENQIYVKEYSMAMNGDGGIVAVGSPRHPGMDSGIVGIYNSFNILASQVLNGTQTNALFGSQLELTDDGSRIAISSPWQIDKKGAKHVGIIQIFEKRDSQNELWIQVGDDIYGKEENEVVGLDFLHISSSGGKRVLFSVNHSGDIDVNHRVLFRVYQLDETSQTWIQLGSDIARPTINEEQRIAMATAFSADGDRFAVSYYSEKPSSHPGELNIYEWNLDLRANPNGGTWEKVGSTISSIHEGFGRSMSMSADGTLLATSTVDPSCDGQNDFEHGLRKSTDLCNTGSFQLYRYKPTNPPHRLFSELPMQTQNIMGKVKRAKDDKIIGLQVSLSGDGSALAISGYNLEKDFGDITVYNVSEVFYMDCIVEYPNSIGNGVCASHEPYYTAQCGFDGGDCPLPSSVKLKGNDELEGYGELEENDDNCKVAYPGFIGSGICYDELPYNSKECNYDGGDCPRPSPVEGYPNCFVSYPANIGDDTCYDILPYNSYECGFDGGDCLPSEFAPTSPPSTDK